MKTKNMMIREYFKSNDDYATREFMQSPINLEESQRSFHYIFLNCNLNSSFRNELVKLGEDDFREFVVRAALATMVIITDVFVYLRAKEKSGNITDEERLLLFRIMLDIDNNDFRDILQDSQKLEYCIFVSEKLIEESALKKIEYVKALSEEDIGYISGFNIYFEEEYNYYNIEITEEFLLKHLEIWIKKSGLEEGINTIARFILNLFILKREELDSIARIIVPDEDKRIKFMEELNNGDIDTIAPFISSFYESHIENNKNLK